MIYLRYLWYVLKHKWYVFLECCKLGIVWRGVWHDMSKFRPREFFPYAKYFNGNIKKGRDKTGYYKPEDTGDPDFELAWFHHQANNDHHWQYWVVPSNDSNTAVPMSVGAMKEMIADWRGAARAQAKKDEVLSPLRTRTWYLANREKMHLHEASAGWIERELGLDWE